MVLAFNHLMGVLYGAVQVYHVATHFFISPPSGFYLRGGCSGLLHASLAHISLETHSADVTNSRQ